MGVIGGTEGIAEMEDDDEEFRAQEGPTESAWRGQLRRLGPPVLVGLSAGVGYRKLRWDRRLPQRACAEQCKRPGREGLSGGVLWRESTTPDDPLSDPLT